MVQDEPDVGDQVRFPLGIGSLSQDVVCDVEALKTKTQSRQIFTSGDVDGSLEERFVGKWSEIAIFSGFRVP